MPPLRRTLALLALAAFGTAPLPAQQHRAAASSGETVGRITLVDEQPAQVVSLLEKITGRIALRAQDLPSAKINFNSGRDLTRIEAQSALESLLALNGVAVMPEGATFLKVVPATKGREAGSESPPLYVDSVADLPPSGRYVARLFSLRHVPFAAVEPAVKAAVNQARGGSVVTLPASNALLVTDSLSNVQRIEELLGSADVPNKVVFVPLKNTRAVEVVKQLKALQAAGLKTAFAGDVGFEASEVTNQIMAVTNPSNEARIREIITGLDVQNAPVTRSELIPLLHAEADVVVQLVQNLATGNSGSVGKPAEAGGASRRAVGATGVSGSRALRGATPSNVSNQSRGGQTWTNINYTVDPSKMQAANDDASFSPYFTAVADTRSNAIVAYGTDRDLRQVKDLISKVDVQLQQVRIEAVIVEVTLGTAQASGLETLGLGLYTGTQGVAGGRHNGDVNLNTRTANLPSNGKPPLAVNMSLRDFSLETVFNKSRDDSNVKLLSSPVIVTSHNAEALISVGNRQPIITGTTTAIGNGAATQSQIDYQNIGLELVITPRIGANGVVEMDVQQKIESVVGTTTIDNNQQPIIGTRQANSYLTAQNDETIVLAGLQSFNETKTKGKVWLLGDIPWLGEWLFRPETAETKKTELIIFLKPHVLTTSDRVPAADTPGLRDGSITKDAVEDRLAHGVFREVKEPSTVFEREAAEQKAEREEAAREKAEEEAERRRESTGA